MCELICQSIRLLTHTQGEPLEAYECKRGLSFVLELECVPLEASVKAKHLLNVGVLHLLLLDGDSELLDVKFVTQVTRDKKKQQLTRTIFNPL
jgi:hypothetical protein